MYQEIMTGNGSGLQMQCAKKATRRAAYLAARVDGEFLQFPDPWKGGRLAFSLLDDLDSLGQGQSLAN